MSVALIRGGATIATAPTATTEPDGSWSATLPEGHATRLSGSPKLYDVIKVTYSGPGAPAGATYEHPGQIVTENGEQFVEQPVEVAADGASIRGFCRAPECTVALHVSYATGSTSEPPPTVGCNGCEWSATLSPAVSTKDLVSATLTAPTEKSLLSYTAPAPLPGRTEYLAQGPPACELDWSTVSLTCSGLINGTYEVKQTGSTSYRTSLTVEGSPYTSTLELPSAQPGDIITVSAVGGKTLTTLHVATHRVETLKGVLETTESGTCAPGDLIGSNNSYPDAVCPASGSYTLSGFEPYPEVFDDQSAGGTTASPPAPEWTAPAYEGEVFGPSVYAVQRVPAGTTSTLVSVTPESGPAPALGGSNTTFPATVLVSGLRAGVQYTDTFLLQDAHGDETTEEHRFFVQPVPAGPAGPQGPTGATGPVGRPAGAAAPRAPVAASTGRRDPQAPRDQLGPQVPPEVRRCSSASTRPRVAANARRRSKYAPRPFYLQAPR